MYRLGPCSPPPWCFCFTGRHRLISSFSNNEIRDILARPSLHRGNEHKASSDYALKCRDCHSSHCTGNRRNLERPYLCPTASNSSIVLRKHVAHKKNSLVKPVDMVWSGYSMEVMLASISPFAVEQRFNLGVMGIHQKLKPNGTI